MQYIFQVWQKTKISWQFRDWVPKLTPAQYPFVGAPVVMDVDSDGELDILVPICREDECSHITQMASWSKTKLWGLVACDMQDYTVIKEPFSRVIFRVGEFSLDSFPDMVVIAQATRVSLTIFILNRMWLYTFKKCSMA